MPNLETQTRLYALARDEEERQRLLVAFHTEAPLDGSRELFELLSYNFLVGGAALAVAMAVNWTCQLIPNSFSPNAITGISIASFFAALAGIGLSFIGKAGIARQERWWLGAQRYKNPIILLAGVVAGYQLASYHWSHSDTFRVKEIAVAACLQSASCLSIAKSANHGEDIRWYVGQLAK